MSDESQDDRTAVLETARPATSADEPRPRMPGERVLGVVLARLVAVESPDAALAALKGASPDTPVRARTLASLSTEDVGREVALMFEEGDPARPMIIGLIEDAPTATVARPRKRPVVIDAESITLEGGREIVLRCGRATLTLTRDGKLFLRGAYVETQATGVNRIKGGCVKIN